MADVSANHRWRQGGRKLTFLSVFKKSLTESGGPRTASLKEGHGGEIGISSSHPGPGARTGEQHGWQRQTSACGWMEGMHNTNGHWKDLEWEKPRACEVRPCTRLQRQHVWEGADPRWAPNMAPY